MLHIFLAKWKSELGEKDYTTKNSKLWNKNSSGNPYSLSTSSRGEVHTDVPINSDFTNGNITQTEHFRSGSKEWVV